ncbi:MAG TPA: DoxX family protein [Solirubrobacteraceae bacterium]
MKIGRLILRTVVGGYFVGHGTQKLFGWFGGHGLEGTGQFFEMIGLRPGKRHAIAAGAAEAGGGALLVAGAATPLAASVLTATMITAIHRVHAKNGPWVTDQGYEYNLVLIAAVLALAETGPGSPSIDSARGSDMHGPKWALLALALGAIGAAGAHVVAESAPAPAPAPAPATAGDPPGPTPAPAQEAAPDDAAAPSA